MGNEQMNYPGIEHLECNFSSRKKVACKYECDNEEYTWGYKKVDREVNAAAASSQLPLQDG
jgi:hypothetical protein